MDRRDFGQIPQQPGRQTLSCRWQIWVHAAEVNVRFGSKADGLDGSANSQKRTLWIYLNHLNLV